MNSFSKLAEPSVLFAGGSLLTAGGAAKLLCELASRQYRSIRPFHSAGALTAAQHLEELKAPVWKAALAAANAVILEQRGEEQADDPSAVIQELRGLLAPNTPVYTLIGEEGYPRELPLVEGNAYVYAGYAMRLLVDGGILTYEQLHRPGTREPNHLHGYLAACVIYGTLFTADCEQFADDFLPPDEIPGESDRLKRETMRRLKRAANMACDFSREHATLLKP